MAALRPSDTGKEPNPFRISVRLAISCVAITIVALLIFIRLGHYALWDDEANTALHAKGILATGDTTALIGHNLVAYGGGMCLQNLRDRVTPPLSSYLTAAFMAAFGDGKFAVRLPFALAGMATVLLVFHWMRKEGASWLTLALTGMAFVGNVSFLLYSRQCRYYSVAIFACVALAYIYRHWKGTPRQLAAFTAASLALFASHYVIFLVFYGCLATDWLIWGRREFRVKWRDIALFCGVHLLVCGIIAYIWNPLATDYGGERPHNGMTEKLYLLYWSFRDGNICEFGVGALLLAAPFVYFLRRDAWLLRASLAVAVYMFFLILLTPQRIDIFKSFTADVRYLPPLIPLGIFIAVRVITTVSGQVPWLALILGAIAFFTNALHGGFMTQAGLRSTIALYLGELRTPPPEPYSAAANWINEHVSPDVTIWVQPNYMTYPLMYHAPKAIYGWQLDYPPKPQFEKLDRIHFRYQIPPDYIVAFGPGVLEVQQSVSRWGQAAQYKLVQMIDQLGLDRYRPELFWRTFTPITNFDRRIYAIYIFERQAEGPGQ